MKETVNDNHKIKLYLLGAATEEERRQVEELLFLEDDYEEQIKVVEDDLIENYLSGNLSDDEKNRFERHFLTTPQHRENVNRARSLRNYVFSQLDEKEFVENKGDSESLWSVWMTFFRKYSTLGFAVASAILLAVLGLFFINNVSEKQRLNTQISEKTVLQEKITDLEKQLNTERERNQSLTNQLESTREQIAQTTPPNLQETPLPKITTVKRERETAAIKNPESSKITRKQLILISQTAVLELSAGQTMNGSEDVKTVVITPKTKNLQLKLAVESNEYRHFSVEVNTEDGNVIWQRNNLKAQKTGKQPKIFITLPTKILKAANYRVTLHGQKADGTNERIGSYYYRVERP
jgi:hypothetical protein